MTDREPGRKSGYQDEEFEREVERELARREENRERNSAEDNGYGSHRQRQETESRHDTQTQDEENRARVVSRPNDEQAAQSESGKLGLVASAVLANSPWKMFLSFKTVIATAFATGAYALIFPTIWLLADSFSWPRLVALAAASIVIMIFWMIVAHGLWESSSDEAEVDSRITPAMQNAVTLLTLTASVLFSYAVLFGMIFVAAFVFVSDGLLQSNLGHPVGPMDYVIIAWVATSISTITGSLGGGLEDEEAVRESVNFR